MFINFFVVLIHVYSNFDFVNAFTMTDVSQMQIEKNEYLQNRLVCKNVCQFLKQTLSLFIYLQFKN